MRIFILPDCQVKPGNSIEHLKWAGDYVSEKKPETIVCLGDFADMESLSSYDKGKRSFEGRRYTRDIEAAHEAMRAFLTPIRREQQRLVRNKEKQWKPRMVMLYGNHENRINRAIEDDPKLEGLMSLDDLKYKEFGWEVVPYLKPIVISNIAFSHYFVSGVMGRPVSSARMLLTKHHMSCIAGHMQGKDIAYSQKADGSTMTGIISGSCLAPHHKVLTADLQYLSLSEIKIGDKLVSFDENLGTATHRGRRYKTGVVTNIRLNKGEMFDVTLSSGKIFRTTKDHKWLTNNCCGVRRWTETQNIKVGRWGTKINRLFDEWETDITRDAGWLAGMYDGEGSLYSRKTTGGYCTQLSVHQSQEKNPLLCAELERIHMEKGFILGSSGKTLMKSWRLVGGQSEVAKLLGAIRPARMLNKFKPELLGNLASKNTKNLESVVSVKSIGLSEYIEIEVDTATMIVEGYPHHNCYTHDESYLTPQNNIHWRGCWVCNDVKEDGSFDEMPLSIEYLEKRYKRKHCI